MADEDVSDEIRVLHADLAEWLGNPDAKEALTRFVEQLDADFSMVTLDGEVVRREQLVAGLSAAQNAAPGLAIEISDIEILHRSDESAAVRFKEIHRSGDGSSDRWTTAILVPDSLGRNGLRWRSVHETAVH
ncbi:hypothetical protein [Nocardia concava]|uniref:hypothetical protein n=1 Tax=Nocardia concava TaxID=257281 RepID=UPI00030EF6DA|nr:hypothetical protein [Nocardia concava]